MKKLFAVFTLIATLFMIGTAQAAIPVKVAFHGPETISLGRSLDSMKQYIEKESKGKYRVDIYYSAKLGTMESAYQGLKLGTVQMMLEGPSNLTGFIPVYQMFDLPFLFPSDDVANAVLGGPLGDKILKMTKNDAVTPMRFVPYAHRQFWSIFPIKNMESMNGIKMRSTSSRVHLAVLKALKMNPTPMPASEVYTGLQQATIEGFDLPVAYGMTYRWHEPCKSVFLSNHVFLSQFLIVSNKWWDKLPDEDKEIFKRGIDLLVEVQKTNLAKEEEESTRILKEQGYIFYTPTAEEKEAMIKATAGIENQFPNIDKALLKELRDEVAKLSK